MYRVYVSCEILTVPGIFDNEWVWRVNQTLFEACSKEESLASHHVRIVSVSAVKHSHLRILVKSEWTVPPCTLRTLVQRRTIRWSSSNCVHGSCGYGSNTPAYWIKTESEVPPNTVWTLSRLSHMFHQVLSEPCEDSHKINRALLEPFRVTSLIKL